MLGSRAKSIVRQVGVLAVVTIIVTGLTLLFNLFATIGISVLAGMMAGASRRWNWQVISVSILPGAVVLALGFAMKVPFDLRHRLYLAGMSFGVFWVTWLATYLLMSLEAKGEATTGQMASAGLTPPVESASSPTTRTNSNGDRRLPTAVTVSQAEARLLLDDLQGTWLCEASRVDEPSNKKLFVVEHGKFSLSILNGGGQARLLAQGDLIWQDVAGHQNLIITGRPGLESGEVGKV